MLTSNILELKIKKTISPNAKVWIYQSSRAFTESEADKIDATCNNFVEEWSAHGNNLIADYQLFANRFICLFVDESGHGASGCSIDSSVKFIKSLESEFKISLMNRKEVAYIATSGEIKTVDMHGLADLFAQGEISQETLVFNNLVATTGEMESKWLVPISESWHERMLA